MMEFLLLLRVVIVLAFACAAVVMCRWQQRLRYKQLQYEEFDTWQWSCTKSLAEHHNGEECEFCKVAILPR